MCAENLIFFWRCEEFKLLIDPSYTGFKMNAEFNRKGTLTSLQLSLPSPQVGSQPGDVDAAARVAHDIWTTFVAPSAQLSVNISSAVQRPLHDFFSLLEHINDSADRVANQSSSGTASISISTATTSTVHLIHAEPVDLEQFVQWCHQQPKEPLLARLFSLFDVSQKEIFALMETDSFQRFLRSAAFKTMCMELATSSSSMLSASSSEPVRSMMGNLSRHQHSSQPRKSISVSSA